MPRQKLIERSDGRYACKYNGKFFYGKTPEEAKAKRQNYINDLGLGYNPDMSTITFLEYGYDWLDAYRSSCNTKQRRQYENIIQDAARAMKKSYIRTITATDIQKLYNTLNGMSKSYIDKYRTTIRGIFRAAVQDGIIVRNPAELAQTPKGTAGEHRYLDPWEQDLIVQTYKDHDFGLFAMVMLFAGLRRGEALYFDIDRDVDFDKKVIHVRGAVTFSEGIQGSVSEGKTESANRTIPLSDFLAEALKDHHGLLLSKQDGSMMSLMSFTRKYQSYITFLETKLNGCHKRWYGKTREHKELLKEGKKLPPWKDIHIRCHDFRVTFCTMCYNAGIPIKTLQAWMGHADATMIMSVYAKLTAEKEQFDATKLNDFTNSRFAH